MQSRVPVVGRFCQGVRGAGTGALTAVMGPVRREAGTVMGTSATVQQQARARARVRRIALEHDRVQRDQRVEVAAGLARGALGERASALGQVLAAEVRVGQALSAIIDEGVCARDAAQLCGIDAGEARRLRRSARQAQECRVSLPPAGGMPRRGNPR